MGYKVKAKLCVLCLHITSLELYFKPQCTFSILITASRVSGNKVYMIYDMCYLFGGVCMRASVKKTECRINLDLEL